MATKWTLNCNLDYKGRIVKIKLLPLCLYVEMHDLLMYLSLVNSKYDISIAVESSKEEKTRQHSRGEYAVNKNRLNKSDENFFPRTKLLHNIVIKHYEEYGNKLDKKSINKLYWDYFVRKFNYLNRFTWRIIRKCNHCNNWKKLETQT